MAASTKGQLSWRPGEHHERTIHEFAKYLDKAVPSLGEVAAMAMAVKLWKISQKIKSR